MVKSSSSDNNGVKKGAWTKDEDNKLRAYVQRYGHWNWSLLPKFAGVSRSGKSCRLRWMNYLRPNMKHGNFTIEEDDLVIELHNKLGNKWSRIAANLPGRSDNEIKNRWNSHLKKRRQNAAHITLSANERVETLEDDHANQKENPLIIKTDQGNQEEGVSSESSSNSSRTSSCQMSGTDCSVLSDFTSNNTFDDELIGNFWTEPFLQDNDGITQSGDYLLSPYDFDNEYYFTSQSSCEDLIIADECLWSTMEYTDVYNNTI